jgi:hypothetical protein
MFAARATCLKVAAKGLSRFEATGPDLQATGLGFTFIDRDDVGRSFVCAGYRDIYADSAFFGCQRAACQRYVCDLVDPNRD